MSKGVSGGVFLGGLLHLEPLFTLGITGSTDFAILADPELGLSLPWSPLVLRHFKVVISLGRHVLMLL